MKAINLKIAELRKARGLTQQELGDLLSVSFQTISKWENNVTMPDITFLPVLAECFEVTVDELLGLKPLAGSYRPNRSGTKEYWEQRLSYLERTRKDYWNRDYIQFLVEKVWKIEKPVKMLDCGCGYGAVGILLLPFLPEGSSYTGIDISGKLLEKGMELFKKEGYSTVLYREASELHCKGNADARKKHSERAQVSLVEANVLQQPVQGEYDVVISNAVMRHLDTPQVWLEKMIQFTKEGGLVIDMDVNREFECDGLYLDGMDYAKLCAHPGFIEMWRKEKEEQGRDYSIAMKLPHLMRKLGLVDVDARMNDRISFVAPGQEEYGQHKEDFLAAQGWDRERSEEEIEEKISDLVSHGMERKNAMEYCGNQNAISEFVTTEGENLAYSYMRGVVIAYGWK